MKNLLIATLLTTSAVVAVVFAAPDITAYFNPSEQKACKKSKQTPVKKQVPVETMLTYNIEGMKCESSCTNKIREMFVKVNGVQDVKVDFAKKEAYIFGSKMCSGSITNMFKAEGLQAKLVKTTPVTCCKGNVSQCCKKAGTASQSDPSGCCQKKTDSTTKISNKSVSNSSKETCCEKVLPAKPAGCCEKKANSITPIAKSAKCCQKKANSTQTTKTSEKSDGCCQKKADSTKISEKSSSCDKASQCNPDECNQKEKATTPVSSKPKKNENTN